MRQTLLGEKYKPLDCLMFMESKRKNRWAKNSAQLRDRHKDLCLIEGVLKVDLARIRHKPDMALN